MSRKYDRLVDVYYNCDGSVDVEFSDHCPDFAGMVGEIRRYENVCKFDLSRLSTILGFGTCIMLTPDCCNMFKCFLAKDHS